MSFKQKYKEILEEVSDQFYDKEKFVPAVGNEDAKVMLVGEAPGADEVKEKEPFVGRAGQKLDEILENIGVERKDLYITNLVKVRPPDNRNPHKDEIKAWRPLLKKEIKSVDPDFILTLGNFPSREILDTKEGITQIRGEVHTIDGRKVMPVFHPAATLYDHSKTPTLENDLRKAFGKKQTAKEDEQTSLGDH